MKVNYKQMNKEALLKIILSDINEVETLLKSFQGSEEIPSAFIDLTERKLTHILEEFGLLKSINHPISTSSIKETVKENITSIKEDVSDTIQENISSKEIIEEIKEKSIEVDAVKTSSNIKVEEKEIKAEIVVESKKEEQPVSIQEPEPQNKVESINQEPIVTTATIPEPEAKPKEENSKTLGESLGGEKKSVNDIISNNKESKLQQTLLGKPVADLTKSLGLNDRFMFQRELFEGNTEVMKQTLLQLNEMPDFKSAQAFISTNFNWDNELEATQAFYNYIKRKYY